MKDEEKTKEELLAELETLRERVAELEQGEVEASLRASEEQYRSLVESTDDSIYVVDSDFRYIFMNRKHRLRMGFSDDQYIGRTYGEFHSLEETNVFIQRVGKVLRTGVPLQNEYRSRRDGRSFLQTLSPINGPDGTAVAVSVVSKNITELKQLEDRLLSLSLTDELTGLYNRRGFFTLADQQLRLANRLKTGIFLLYADLDGLKHINDTYGHKEGDNALVETAAMLKKNYRESDITARIGGDEFVVVPVGTSKDHVEVITERFIRILSAHNAQEDRKYELSISIGLGYYDPAEPVSLDELLMQADRMMYEEKRRKQKAKA